ncbi:MAG: TolB-like 6-bladed beta-propeller domain-containing protein [Bacteroidales bacterium]|nr:TolB-like 6-bladed beta-propeller domain-containing protein [Bacteroidales bacterium]
MNKNHSFLIFLIALFSFYSRKDNVPYFNGEIESIEFTEKKYVSGDLVDLRDVYTGYMSVNDSIMVFSSSKYRDYRMNCFNPFSGNLQGEFCRIGRGPNEFINFTHTEQYIYDEEDIKLWVSDNFYKHYLLNLTSSIKKQETVFDSIIRINWRKDWVLPFSFIFILDDDLILAKNQDQTGRNNEYILCSYHLYKGNLDTKIRDYTLYNKPIKPSNQNIPANLFYMSLDRIKPDHTKIAMSMYLLGQINILDLQTGILKGFRLKDTEDFSALSGDPDNLSIYYIDICTDNNYIYALLVNTPFAGGEGFDKSGNLLHILDWDGNPVCEIQLDKNVFQIALDQQKGLLYGIDEDTDLVYRFDIQPLLP